MKMFIEKAKFYCGKANKITKATAFLIFMSGVMVTYASGFPHIVIYAWLAGLVLIVPGLVWRERLALRQAQFLIARLEEIRSQAAELKRDVERKHRSYEIDRS